MSRQNVSVVTSKDQELRTKIDDLVRQDGVNFNNALLALNKDSSSISTSQEDVIDLSAQVPVQ